MRLPRIPNLGVDALYGVRGQPGAASRYYKFSADPKSSYNIFGDRYLGKLQADWAKGITSGGNRQVHKILTGLGTSKTGSKQGFVKRQPNIGKLFSQYFKTGVRPTALSPAQAKHAYDYALRATGRDAVMDRQGSFFGNLLKGNVGSILGTAAGLAFAGPLGAKFGGMAGGAAQGGFRGGFTGALAGALPLTSWTNKRDRKTPNLNRGNSMQYFAGSLSNPKIPSGKDNRNVSPAFSGSFSRGGAQPSSQQGMPLQPRNEAFSLPRILNPSPAYKAFAIPQGISPYLRAIYQSFGPNRYRV